MASPNTPSDSAPATDGSPEALAAWLQARPDVALAVMTQLRIARPWRFYARGAYREDLHGAPAGTVRRDGRRWRWHCRPDEFHWAPTRREAMRQVDEWLREDGVGLAA